MLDYLGLASDEAAVYEALLDRPGATVAQLAEAVAADLGRVTAAVEGLEAEGLADRAADNPDRLTPTPPRQAFEPALLERQRELDEARACVRSLAGKWRRTSEAMEADAAVSSVNGRQACLELWREAHGSARTQVRAIERPPYLMPQTEPNPVEVELLARRVPHRVLYDSAVITLPCRLDELKVGIENGEKARVHPAVPLRALLIDERMALLPVKTGQHLTDGLLVVRPCALFDALAALFELLWEQAVPLRFGKATRRSAEQSDCSLDHLILKLMAAGLSDAKIARQLGLSMRTLQRRLANTMNRLGATTRLQAGVQAARKGWV